MWVKVENQAGYWRGRMIGRVPILGHVIQVCRAPTVWAWGVLDHTDQIRRDGITRSLQAAKAAADRAAEEVARITPLH